MPGGAPIHRARNNLLALGSAAVLTVYAAGYLRTREAAERFAVEDAERLRPPSAEVRQAAPDVVGQAITTSTGGGGAQESRTAGAGVLGDSVIAAPVVPAGRARATGARATDARAAANNAGNALPAPSPSPVASTQGAARPTDSTVSAANSSSASSATAEPPPAQVPAQAPSPSPAAAAADAAPAEEAAAPNRGPYRDGSFSGWGNSRHGQIQVTVEIQNGHITDARISACWTRWSCQWVAHLQGQVVARQSAEVDYVSGATQSGNAFYWAAVDALAKAR